MARNEAPAATIGGVNGKKGFDRAEIVPPTRRRLRFSKTVRPASLLRKSIQDLSLRTSASAGCTATFNLRATLEILQIIMNSIAYDEILGMRPNGLQSISSSPPKN
jgi:hypothetical protein